LFDSESKCQSACSPHFVFGELLHQQNLEQSCSAKDVGKAWMAAIPHAKELAKEWIKQGPFLMEELQKALQTAQGSVSWEKLGTLVFGSGNLQLAGQKAIWRHVVALPEPACQSTKLLPGLGEANIQRSIWWSPQFWAFWKIAAPFEAAQVLLAHINEKWLWLTAVCTHLKPAPFLGIEPVQHGVQHKNHLDKIVGVASAAFAPKGNKAEAGGHTFQVNLVWAGKMMPAKKDTC